MIRTGDNPSICVLSRLARLCAMAAVISLLTTVSVQASLVLSVVPASISGTVGTGVPSNKFELDLSNTGPSSVTVGSFGFTLTSGSPFISFTDARIDGTTQPYIFAGTSAFAVANSIATSTGTTLQASDESTLAFNTPPGGTTIVSGATASLGRVTFDISPSIATGAYAVTITPSPGTSVSDPNGGNLPITTINNGVINVVNGAGGEVPEPATLGMGLTAAAFGAGLILRRRKPAAPALSE